MEEQQTMNCTAFEGSRCLAAGSLAHVAQKVKELLEQNQEVSVLIFNDVDGETVEVDFRGSVKDVLKRLPGPAVALEPPSTPPAQTTPRKPGRPKLGVVSREVTLLPRHWEWLGSQPGGASVTLRKLVEQARRTNRDRDQARHSQEAAYRFMSAMAGNLPGFEEATRALFAGDPARFNRQMQPWPADIREYALKLSQAAFPKQGE